MVDVPDDAAARREHFRAATGEFGVIPVTAPEVILGAGGAPAPIARLYAAANEAHERLSHALVTEIDATMPAEADFVNYDVHPDGTHLVISEALGEFGEDLGRAPFAHIDTILVQLGQPDADFDGDLVTNSLGEFGWERETPYDPARGAAATVEAAGVRSAWERAVTTQQKAVCDALGTLMGRDVEAFEFSWDAYIKALTLDVVILSGRRQPAPMDLASRCNDVAAYISAPEHAALQRDERTGKYRLCRPGSPGTATGPAGARTRRG